MIIFIIALLVCTNLFSLYVIYKSVRRIRRLHNEIDIIYKEMGELKFGPYIDFNSFFVPIAFALLGAALYKRFGGGGEGSGD